MFWTPFLACFFVWNEWHWLCLWREHVCTDIQELQIYFCWASGKTSLICHESKNLALVTLSDFCCSVRLFGIRAWIIWIFQCVNFDRTRECYSRNASTSVHWIFLIYVFIRSWNTEDLVGTRKYKINTTQYRVTVVALVHAWARLVINQLSTAYDNSVITEMTSALNHLD